MNKFTSPITIGLGTLILSIIGLYNGFPLFYSDSGTYIASGFEMYIPFDRPISYGLFIRLFSLGSSTWFVIFIQNLLTAFVLFEFIKLFNLKRKRFTRYYLCSLLFLVFFTGIGWYSNQLMPDFFAPLSLLLFFIILIRKHPFHSPFRLSIIPLIFIFSLITHFSHIFTASVLISILVIFKIVFKNKLKDLSFKKIAFVAGLVCSSWILLPSLNYLVEKQFILSKGSHIFLMAHLNDTGILKKFLTENCSKQEYNTCKLCNYKDSLPNDLASFMWSSKIIQNTGGWEGSKEEYHKIIMATLTHPKYLFLNIYKSFTYGFIQLAKIETGQGLTPYNKGTASYNRIHTYFHNELNNYVNSKQNRWEGVNLNFDRVNFIHLSIIILSLFILTLLFTHPILSKINSISLTFVLFVIVSIVLNAFITAGLNAPCERFQSRVVWLLPFSILILIVKNYKLIIKTIYGIPNK